jgi:hypothetical protein
MRFLRGKVPVGSSDELLPKYRPPKGLRILNGSRANSAEDFGERFVRQGSAHLSM